MGPGARWAVVAVALAIAVAAYASAIPGGFVSDDDVQIVRNAHVQDGRLLWAALGSDVWGFARSGAEPVSSYWRPLFVTWLVANHRLFGLAPMGWHVSSLVLHGLAILLASVVLARLAIAPAVAAAALWTFAAHPVHVEAVAWASGAPDLLLAVCVLGSLALHLADRSRPALAKRVAATLLFAGALLAKETAILVPVFVLFCEWVLAGSGQARRRLGQAALRAAPYFFAAAAVMTVRVAVLGALIRPAAARPDLASFLLVLPRAFSFYLRQALWPVTLGPVYPLRAAAPGSVPLSTLLPAILATAAALAAGTWLWRRGVAYRVGIAIFVTFLAPALLGVGELAPERLVQDRYLYLPVLGLGVVFFQALAHVAAPRIDGPIADRTVRAVGLVLALLLAILTGHYNLTWRDDISLWERAVELNPDSAHSFGTLGYHYRVAGRTADAKAVLLRAERLDPGAPQVLLDAGILAADEGDYLRAKQLLGRALDAAPGDETIPDHLGRVLLALGEHDAAIELFSAARDRHPDLRLKSTINLAVCYRAAGRPERAAAELRSIRGALELQTDPTLLLGLWQLGEVESDLGRAGPARAAHESFLRCTAGMSGPLVELHRRLAAERLAELARSAPLDAGDPT